MSLNTKSDGCPDLCFLFYFEFKWWMSWLFLHRPIEVATQSGRWRDRILNGRNPQWTLDQVRILSLSSYTTRSHYQSKKSIGLYAFSKGQFYCPIVGQN